VLGPRIREISRPGDLPGPCRSCVFWEAPSGRPGPTPGGEAGKEAWWRAAELEWGPPGKGVYLDDELAGYVLYGPPEHFPRIRASGRTASDDALLLATLWVAEDHRGGGLGKTLLQVAMREAARRNLRAVEALAVRDDDPPAWRCTTPAGFLEAHGFAVFQDDARHPLLRLDLRQTVRWQEQVGHALESVVSALSRRERLPKPAPDTGLARTGMAKPERP